MKAIVLFCFFLPKISFSQIQVAQVKTVLIRFEKSQSSGNLERRSDDVDTVYVLTLSRTKNPDQDRYPVVLNKARLIRFSTALNQVLSSPDSKSITADDVTFASLSSVGSKPGGVTLIFHNSEANLSLDDAKNLAGIIRKELLH